MRPDPSQELFRARVDVDGLRRGIVRFAGELDLAGVERANQAVAAALASGTGLIVLDLRELTYMDSSGIKVLVHASHWAKAEKRRLIVVYGTGVIARVLDLVGLSDHLERVGDLSELPNGDMTYR